MAKLTRYRQIIEKILTEYRDWAADSNQVGVQECIAFDREHNHYFWFSIGWNDKQRDFSINAYLRLKDGKIWIEEDWTKQGIANDLLEAGVTPEDIVLGFQHPSKRPLTEFAIA
ncbi:MAG: XisI protein [Cyanobacteria bacterium RI_101]|nr:XisI protein [Cyanobacteria bacterium RI_101]